MAAVGGGSLGCFSCLRHPALCHCASYNMVSEQCCPLVGNAAIWQVSWSWFLMWQESWDDQGFIKLRNIQPRENIFVAICAGGEGWHNYHHVFPWDYRTGEIGGNRPNVTAKLIDLFEWMGWAYDLKTVPESVIAKRAARSGDGSAKPFYFSTK